MVRQSYRNKAGEMLGWQEGTQRLLVSVLVRRPVLHIMTTRRKHKLFESHDWEEEGRQLLVKRFLWESGPGHSPSTLIAWVCTICGKTMETERRGHWTR